MHKSKCVIILSNKCSGSSAIQNLLCGMAHVNHVKHTRHSENETLYWTKAASILGRPQIQLLDSEVPLPESKARTDLIDLLQTNAPDFVIPDDDSELIFEGWRRLCISHAPVFLEKSPHHLCQWSAIELMLECVKRLEGDVEFLFVGLVRNPMDTLYSAFKRWKSLPEELQHEWFTGYKNLQRLSELIGDKLITVRYEDVVKSLDPVIRVLDFCGADMDSVDSEYLHRKAIQKWKKDKLYGFQLAPEVAELAGQYGYSEDQLENEANMLWRITSRCLRFLRTPIDIARVVKSTIVNRG